MPYISSDLRDKLLPIVDTIRLLDINEGELNYLITILCDTYLYNKGINYSNINNAIGVLECAKLELYRRIAVNYENKKLEINGDVYETK